MAETADRHPDTGNGLMEEMLRNAAKKRQAYKAKATSDTPATSLSVGNADRASGKDSNLPADSPRRNDTMTMAQSRPLVAASVEADNEVSRERETQRDLSWRPTTSDDGRNRQMWDKQMELMTNLSSTVVNLQRKVDGLTERGVSGPRKRRFHDAFAETSVSSDDSEDDYENGFEELLAPVAASGKNETASEEADILAELSEFFEMEERCGPAVSDKLAKVANAGMRTHVSVDKIKELTDKHLRPMNAEGLIVPKVNPEIWSKLKRPTKQLDTKLQRVQGNVSQACVPLITLMDKLLTCKETGKMLKAEEILPQVSDAFRLLSFTYGDISQKRKDFVRPDLHHSFQSLCTSQNKVTDMLFGDDLGTKVKNINEAQRMGNRVSGRTTHTYMQRSSQPYNKNAQRPFLYQRGGGRPHHAQQYQRHHQQQYGNKKRGKYPPNTTQKDS